MTVKSAVKRFNFSTSSQLIWTGVDDCFTQKVVKFFTKVVLHNP